MSDSTAEPTIQDLGTGAFYLEIRKRYRPDAENTVEEALSWASSQLPDVRQVFSGTIDFLLQQGTYDPKQDLNIAAAAYIVAAAGDYEAVTAAVIAREIRTGRRRWWWARVSRRFNLWCRCGHMRSVHQRDGNHHAHWGACSCRKFRLDLFRTLKRMVGVRGRWE